MKCVSSPASFYGGACSLFPSFKVVQQIAQVRNEEVRPGFGQDGIAEGLGNGPKRLYSWSYLILCPNAEK